MWVENGIYLFLLAAGIIEATEPDHPSVADSNAGIEVESPTPPVATVLDPTGRFEVEFSEPRTDDDGVGEDLWAAIKVRDKALGTERRAHVAEGRRGKGETWQAFAAYADEEEAWSPDGTYLAYRSLACIDQPDGAAVGVQCQDQGVYLLPMVPPSTGQAERVIGKDRFRGWASKHPHRVLELDSDTSERKNSRAPLVEVKKP